VEVESLVAVRGQGPNDIDEERVPPPTGLGALGKNVSDLRLVCTVAFQALAATILWAAFIGGLNSIMLYGVLPALKGNRTALAVLGSVSLIGAFAAFSLLLFNNDEFFQRPSSWLLMLSPVVWIGLYHLGLTIHFDVRSGPAIPGMVAGVMMVLVVTLGFMHFVIVMRYLYKHRTSKGKAASSKKAKRSSVHRLCWSLFTAAKMSSPGLFILAIGLLYVVGIFEAFHQWSAASSSYGGVLAAALGMIVKVVGNKCLLYLMKKLKFSEERPDVLSFQFEYVTALLCRMMLASIAHQFTAMLASVGNAVFELLFRLFFARRLVGKIKLVNDDTEPSVIAELTKEATMRMIDGANDMLVEYVTMVTAFTMVLHMSPQMFSVLTTDNAVPSVEQLTPLFLLQVLPEMAVDLFACYLEARHGLLPLYQEYFSFRLKPTISKFFHAFSITSFVLMVVLKS